MASRVPAGLARAAVALVSAAAMLSALAVPATAHPRARGADARDTGSAPLAVTIDSITPSTIPRGGDVTLTGKITNRSESSWTELRAYLFMSSTPMTTSAELKDATATPETEDVGGRLTKQGLYDEVSDLKPGETTAYTLSVPRSELPVSGPGVYWIGVHVLGTNEQGRLEGADGRARSFIAEMPDRGPSTTLALAIPLRAHVRRTPDGRVANVGGWNRALADDGRLTRLVDMARSSSGIPLTWVVDPAVLDAVRSLGEGNPSFDISPTDEQARESGSPSGTPSGTPSGSPSGSPSASSSESPSPSGVPTETAGPLESGDAQGDSPADNVGQVAAESQQAARWLTNFGDLAEMQTVLALPYGDVDVASLVRRKFPSVFERATELSGEAMKDLGIDASPVVAPANGVLPNADVPRLDADTDLMLSRRAARTDATMIGLKGGPDALLTSDVARIGGPSPTPRFDALAVRQRILAEAAARGLTGPRGKPLVVTTPDLWDPGSGWATASFFTGLEVPWIRMVDVPFARMLSHRRQYQDRLVYPRVARRHEIPVANILATQELNRAGRDLADLLTRNDTIDSQVGRAAMFASSTNARARPARALAMTRNISEQVHHTLQAVTVQGSPLVTMSSGTGNMTVRVVNGLDEPVTVGIRADTGTDELRIRTPDLVSLGPGQRASVRLAVTATGTGVHSVRITPTTQGGDPLGEPTRIKVRSSQVGLVIWLVMGTGAVVFIAAIVARIVRQVRGRKKDGQKAEEPEQEDIAS